MKYNPIKINKNNAFSLVEVLISLVLISLIMVATAPIVTKRITEKTNEGVVYTYNSNNNTTKDNVCYITKSTNYSSANETYVSTKKCSEYQFKVPEGVHKVNITLVAGGGGGGGAAGGKTETKSISTDGVIISHIASNGFKPDILKEIIIKTLVAKGQSGKNVNTDCKTEESKCGGQGGSSSVAFMNFKIPQNYIRGFNFTGGLETPSNLNGKITLEANISPYVKIVTAANSSFNDDNKIEYGIQYSDGSYNPYCYLGSAMNSIAVSGSLQCGIEPPYIVDSIKGDYGRSESNQTTIYADSNGAIFAGGTGGIVSGASNYGSGGTGAYLNLVCADSSNHQCKVAEATASTAKLSTEGKGAYAAVDYTVEYPAGAGGGGAGGAAAKILALDVIPNETYIIRVGSGGKGGTGSVSSSNPKAGSDGTGGTSTAIYDEDDNLIYMVNGGTGGQGGQAYSSSLYAGQIGISGRIAPKIISGDANLISKIKLDTK